MSLRGADISGWQPGNVNLAGLDFVYVKATQGIWKVNANHDAQVAQARAAGLVVGHYHFPAWGDPVQEAQAFIIGSGWRPGEFMVLDIENSPVTPWPLDPVTWCESFEAEVHRQLGIWAMDYAGPNVRALWNWAGLSSMGDGLIDPEYNNVGPSSPDPWANVAMWQNADTNQTGGDSDIFFGDRAALIAYGTPGAVTQSGTITPVQEDDLMSALDEPITYAGGIQGTTTLRNEIAWLASNFRTINELVKAVPGNTLNAPIPVSGEAKPRNTSVALETSWIAANFRGIPAGVWNQNIGPGNAAGVLNNIDAKPAAGAAASTLTGAVAALSETDLANLAKAVNDEADTRAARRLATA